MQPQLFIFSMFQLNKQSHQGICFNNSHLNIHPSLSPSHWELTQWLVAILPLPAADISKPHESRIMRHDCQVGGFSATHLKKYANLKLGSSSPTIVIGVKIPPKAVWLHPAHLHTCWKSVKWTSSGCAWLWPTEGQLTTGRLEEIARSTTKNVYPPGN